MSEDLYTFTYNPDVLNCLANLSNDEVFTPPEVANAMLDMLPQELFRSPNAKFLDPACKSGVFLREIAKRLIIGLADSIPDLQQRLDHIFHNQIYGIGITALTSLLARRSLYCSKYPNSKYSVSVFDTVDGNIRFKNTQHVWKNGKCIFCGAPQSEYDRSTDLEQYAYEFIHTVKPEEILNMKFDVIISNPPYQLNDGGAQASASPLYNLFVKQAQKLNPQYLVMIIPARWYAGGKGLDEFRNEMLNDIHIKELHDFPITNDCFPGVNIRGGVCYFLWDRTYNNQQTLTKVVTHNKNTQQSMLRQLRYENLNIFIRNGFALEILKKINSISKNNSLMYHISPRKPFGLNTDFIKSQKFHLTKLGLKNPIKCYGKNLQIGFIEEFDITAHKEWINVWKVMTSRANNIGTELNDDNLNTIICKPGYVCTESYLIIGADLSLNETSSKNLSQYLKTKFARFCHSLAKSSQDATAKTYRFVPMQDFSKPWTDEELYKKYNLTNEEITFIESMIKPMELGGNK